ncbi:MAG: hypothetical protein RRC34_02760 [Lentisphaeria bacterium]|nr:hypothetical protein [Lentisphaeria bacterium]
MRAQFLSLSLIFILLGTAFASLAEEAPGELWISGYSKYMEGLEVEKAGNDALALRLFRDAARDMQTIKSEHPEWKADVVTFRLEKCHRKIDVLNTKLTERQSDLSKDKLITLNQTLQTQISDLEQQVAAALEKAEAARSVAPLVPVEPPTHIVPEPIVADDKALTELQSENDMLKAEVSRLKEHVAAGENALKEANKEIAKGEKLRKDIRDLNGIAADLEANLSAMADEKAAVRAQVKQLRDERREMADKLEVLSKQVSALQADSAALRQQNDALRQQIK